MDNKDWKNKLTSDQYRVLREKATEAPYSGKFLYHKDKGTYICIACGTELFNSESKYESDVPGLSGWPSFDDVLDSGAVKLVDDNSWGMHRTEVVCAKCGGHLGHLFDDPSAPSGQHYCINSVCLDFKPASNKKS